MRYDKSLTDKEKLLFGEITSLCNKEGYCWASNSYFAELYNVAQETISRCITKLIKAGYIKREIIYKENSKEIEKRLLYPLTNLSIPIDENVKDNNTSINKESNISISKPINNTPTNITKERKKSNKITIEEGLEIAREIFEKEELEDIDNFMTLIKVWLIYKQQKGQSYVPIGFKRIVANLLKYSNRDYDTASKIIDRSITSCYSGLFELNKSNEYYVERLD